MKNIWKWILGIVLVVVVVGGLAGAVFVAHNMMAARVANRQVSAAPGNPSQPPGGDNSKNGPTQRGFPGWHGPGRGPMMDGGRFGFSPFGGRVPFRGGFPFGPGFMIMGGLMRLIPLALLALLVVGAYVLGKRARVPETAIVAPVPTHACPKCGEPVQDGSKYCPSCGKKQ